MATTTNPGQIQSAVDIRVSTLAPGIVEAILEGRQPLGLSARGLMRMSHALPLDWTAQRKFLGFAAV